MARNARLSLLLFLVVWFGFDARSLAQAIPAAAVPIEQITVGSSTVPLNGPWKFHIGDSPADPASNAPLWAKPEFDDSNWETVDLTQPGRFIGSCLWSFGDGAGLDSSGACERLGLRLVSPQGAGNGFSG